MNTKQRKTLEKIMTTPVLANIKFDDVVKCMLAMGYDFNKNEGSRVSFSVGLKFLSLHKPHPQKELKRYAIKELQLFIRKTKKDYYAIQKL